MKSILIVGLGLMGGSYALGLTNKGYTVYGVDINEESIKYAIDNKYIIDGSSNPLDFVRIVDVIIIGLYPTKILDFLNKYNNYFNEKQIITDLSGVKTAFIDEAIKASLKAEYITHHPMAGKEKSGITYSNTLMFNNANFLICPTSSNTNRAIEIIREIGLALDFGKISIIDPLKHDKMIAYTSQLTHAIAVSLVNADNEEDTKNFVGDSYRDLTRIAKINEELWSELFFENKTFLLEKIQQFEIELDKLKLALIENNQNELKEIFIKSTKKRKEMEQ